MTDDLVQRLRRTYRKEFAVTGSMFGDISNRLRPFPILATEVLFNPDGREAADRIEALIAENERLEALFTNSTYEAKAMMEEIDRRGAEIQALREMQGKDSHD
jgi:hypothetical protein